MVEKKSLFFQFLQSFHAGIPCVSTQESILVTFLPNCQLPCLQIQAHEFMNRVYAQTLVSNQPSWLNFSTVTCSHALEESIGTRVLIPLPVALVELFVNKQISEDQNVIDFITTQYNILVEQEALINTNNMDTSFCENINAMSEIQSRTFLGNEIDKMDPNNHLQPPNATAFENLNMSYDISVDRTRLCSSPMNLQQFGYNSESRMRNDAAFSECSLDPSSHPDKHLDSSLDAMQPSMMNDTANMHMQFMEQVTANKEQNGTEKDLNKQDEGRSNSVSDCSDQIDDEEDGKYRRKSGKSGQCKNLVAERRRRKKLNERLYTLRSLVPKISKLDRASILGDAIEYVKDLQSQAKELQDELEEHSDSDGQKNTNINGKRNNVLSETLSRDDTNFRCRPEHEKVQNEFHLETSGSGSISKQNQESETTNDKAPQMEPQVEVAQIDGNEFFVKVFCEHKPGRFVRLMEALNSLALEVTNANVTTFRNLVSNVLKVEKKDSKIVVQADHLRDFLLELTRNPSRGLSEMSKASDNSSSIDYQHHHHHQPSY
ncbi:transcription factor ABORTED MICROSPORES isoform X2 [Humulus lupulus]|uniref:transcription factor ABORTED MICROSPORES isoform X2 n=1 Tax=Humulus lupulus TaxID=3486 RepID=UPI002B40D7ED|nr:transcription factor ABORTED MICROSPORES isoform X2 [Humulus lupulus]